MIAKDSERILKTRRVDGKMWSWISLVVTLLLLGAGIWYLLSKVTLSELAAALKLARIEFILLSIAAMLISLLLKAERWCTLLSPREPQPSFSASFWATMLGQYVNLLVPFLRLGELARVYALNRQLDVSKTRALSTLVLEKGLDLLMLALMMALLLSTVVLPEYIGSSSLAFGAIAVLVLVTFYLLAYRTEFLIGLLEKGGDRLPAKFAKNAVRYGISGLAGLAALRDRRTFMLLLGQSALIGVFSLLTPLALFPALNIGMGLTEATLIHVVVTMALVPPTTPGKLVVFDGTVAFLLSQLGLEEGAVVAAYTIVYHIVILVPQILLGSVSTSRTNWRWKERIEDGISNEVGNEN